MLKIPLCFTGVNSILKSISYLKNCNNILQYYCFHFHNITYHFCKNIKSLEYIYFIIYNFCITLRNNENKIWNKWLIVQPRNVIFLNLIKWVFQKWCRSKSIWIFHNGSLIITNLILSDNILSFNFLPVCRYIPHLSFSYWWCISSLHRGMLCI